MVLGRPARTTPHSPLPATTGTVRPRQSPRRDHPPPLSRSFLRRGARDDHAQHRRPAPRRRAALLDRADQRRRARFRLRRLSGSRGSRLMADFAFLTVAALGQLLRQKKTTASELAAYFLDRLERIGPRFNAVVTVTRDRALDEAARADREIRQGKWRGPLHGIPYGVKDLIATKGYPTTWGAEPYRQQKLDLDATVVERLGAAGAVLVAKLAMVELAGGMGYNQANASFTGPGKTPWNPEYWSGGSSSGPGAAVAAGLVPFAIGSETSGSILTPSAYCGVTGLRPTYGLVSRYGAMALAWTMDKLGPMGRTAEDCGIVLAVIEGKDPKDPSSVARVVQDRLPRPRRFRVGVPKGADQNIQ